MGMAGAGLWGTVGRGLRGIGRRVGDKQREDELLAQRKAEREEAQRVSDERFRIGLLTSPNVRPVPVGERDIGALSEPLDVPLPDDPFAPADVQSKIGGASIALPDPDLDMPDLGRPLTVMEPSLPEGAVPLPGPGEGLMYAPPIPEPDGFNIHGKSIMDPDEAIELHGRFAAAARAPAGSDPLSASQARLRGNDERERLMGRARGHAVAHVMSELERGVDPGALLKQMVPGIRRLYPGISYGDAAGIASDAITQATTGQLRAANTQQLMEKRDELDPTAALIAAAQGRLLGGKANAFASPVPEPGPRRERAFTQAAPEPADTRTAITKDQADYLRAVQGWTDEQINARYQVGK